MKIILFNYQLRIYILKLEKRIGVNSQKYNDVNKHILMWDFDEASLATIYYSLYTLLKKYRLPTIYIVRSSPKKYHAYCFTARTFLQICHILSDTPKLDIAYFRIGIIRGYFTLRITPRKDEPNFKLVKIIWSIFPNETLPMDITTSTYYTSNKGGNNG